MERKEKPWIDDIINAYEHYGGTAPYSQIYAYFEEYSIRILPRTYKAIIRNRVETCSSDSENYRPGNPDLFYSVKGIGSGVWGLRRYKP